MKSRFRPLLLALLALLCAGTLHAQPTMQMVRGRVVDRATGEPVANASVRVLESQGNAAVSGQTDVVGRFSIRLPIAGTYTLTAERIGFSTFTSGEVQVAAGATVEVELRMASTTLALDSVAVRVRQVPPFRDQRAARFWDRQERARGNYLTPEQIAMRPRVRTEDLLRDMPSVYLAGDTFHGSTVMLGVGAARRCKPTLYIDGIRRRLEQGERLDDYVDRPRLWAIEVYPRSADAPADLPPDDNILCGVIAIWTLHA